MKQSHSIWVKLERFPPVLVRLLAKDANGELLPDHEIVLLSKGELSLADVRHLSYLPCWDEVPVAKMKNFCLACGVDFADRETMRTLTRYISKRPKFQHLRQHPRFPEFKLMLNELATYAARTRS